MYLDTIQIPKNVSRYSILYRPDTFCPFCIIWIGHHWFGVFRTKRFWSSDLYTYLQDQPQGTPKSKIPVLRSSSVKVPREICFGYGVNRSFSQRISNWYQKNSQPSNVTLKSIDKTNFDDMKMALDWRLCHDISPDKDEKTERYYFKDGQQT